MTGETWRVIVQITIAGRRECRRFADVPVVEPAHIAVMSDGSSQGDRDAGQLYDAIVREVTAFVPGGASPSVCNGPMGLRCMGRSEPACRSVLVAIGDGRTPFPAGLLQTWTSRGPARGLVLPVLPRGASPRRVLGPGLGTTSVLFHSGVVPAIVPDVLRAAAIGGEDHRLFISYRRADAEDLAEQLHDAFTHIGFRVFLDRFHSTAGRPFPRELAEELMDKGCVLVIESPSVRASPWILAEVAFACAYRLGLLALHMEGASTMSFVPSRDRYSPARSDWMSGARTPTLTGPALDRVVAFVRQRFPHQILRRRVYLENLLRAALHPHGVAAAVDARGVHRVRARGGSPEYAVFLASRPPGLTEARRVREAAPPPVHPVLVGPSGLQQPDRAADLRWLATTLNVRLAAEARLRILGTDLADGRIL